MKRSHHHLIVRAHQLGRPTAAWLAAAALDAVESGLPVTGTTTRLAEQGLFEPATR